MITNKTSRSILAGVLVAFAGTFASAQVLLENDFDSNTSGDIGAALVGGNGADPDTGFVPGGGANGDAGFGSDTGYDASTADSLTISWTVESFTTNATTKYIWHDGWGFGMRAGTSSGYTYWKNAAADVNPKVVFAADYNAASWSVTDIGTNGTSTAHVLTGVPTLESLFDGFTVTLTVKNDDTWELVTSNMSVDLSTNGTLSANVTFAELASNVMPVMTLGGNSECVLSYVQLSKAAAPAAPTPGTLIYGK